jgi:hypothetical protein
MTQAAAVETLTQLSSADELGDEAFSAVQRGDVLRFHELLDQGLDINQKDDKGYTLLMYAVRTNHTEIAREILLREVDPEARCDAGMSALMLAAAGGNVEIAKMLLDNIEDPELAMGDGEVAEQLALKNGNYEVLEVIRARRRREHFNKEGQHKVQKHKKSHREHLYAGQTEEGVEYVCMGEDKRLAAMPGANVVEEASKFIGTCAHKCADTIKGGWKSVSRFAGRLFHRAAPATPEGEIMAEAATQLFDAAAQVAEVVENASIRPAPQPSAPKSSN